MEIRLRDEIAHYYRKDFVLYPKKRHNVKKSGRAVTKSTFHALFELFRAYMLPKCDAIVIGFEANKLKDNVIKDFKFVINNILHLGDYGIFKVFEPTNGPKYIRVLNRFGEYNYIKIFHCKGKSDAMKGVRPEAGHLGGSVRYYELQNFEGGNSFELMNNNATFARDAWGKLIWENIREYCKEHNIDLYEDEKWVRSQEGYREEFKKNPDKFLTKGFCILYEYNTPIVGVSRGAWVSDGEKTIKDDPAYDFKFNTYLDMTDEEKGKFLKEQGLEAIELAKRTNPVEYENVYLGKEGKSNLLTYPNLNDTHYGKGDKDFQPNYFYVGADIGHIDATSFCFNQYQLSFNKPVRVAFGVKHGYHCNRGMKFIKDDKPVRDEVFKKCSLHDYVVMFREFLTEIANEYKDKIICVGIDRSANGISFYQETIRDGRKAPYNIRFLTGYNPVWEQINITERVDLANMLIGTNSVKFYSKKLFDAFKYQVNKEIPEENGKIVLLQNSKREDLDMDSQDSCFYGIDKGLFSSIVARLRKHLGKALVK